MRKRTIAWAASAVILFFPARCGADIKLTEAQAKQSALVKPLPEYPATARQLRITGSVELEVVIAPDGGVEQVRIVTGNPVLTKACAKAVGAWKFKPILENGKPARATAPLSFDFR